MPQTPPPFVAMSEIDRHPLPPEVLADALQDRVHQDTGRVRAAKSVRVNRPAVFCDYCTCPDCAGGAQWLKHAPTEDGRWICDVCYWYECCVCAWEARDKDLPISEVPCRDEHCQHRPTLVGPWDRWSGPMQEDNR